jgi:hypothetical protein
MANMFTMKSGKQVDLANPDSMKVVAQVYDDVINLNLYVKKVDSENALDTQRQAMTAERNVAVGEAYKKGVADGRTQVPVSNVKLEDIIKDMKRNGVQVQRVINDSVVTENYASK